MKSNNHLSFLSSHNRHVDTIVRIAGCNFELVIESVGALALPVLALTKFGNLNSYEIHKLIFTICTPTGRF